MDKTAAKTVLADLAGRLDHLQPDNPYISAEYCLEWRMLAKEALGLALAALD